MEIGEISMYGFVHTEFYHICAFVLSDDSSSSHSISLFSKKKIGFIWLLLLLVFLLLLFWSDLMA